MQSQGSSLMFPQIEKVLEKVGSKFYLVTLSAKRARQINSYYNQLGEGIGNIIPPQVATTARKPLSIALAEIAENKITLVKQQTSAQSEKSAS